MADGNDRSYETTVETNRWESFTRLTFSYFADEGYAVEQEFNVEDGSYELRFTDDERDEEALFRYNGSPPDMAQESLQGMQRLFDGSAELSEMWRKMLQ